MVNFGLEKCSNLPKFKVLSPWIAKNDIFGLFEFAKIWFRVKSEWWLNDQISTKSSLNFTFWKFLEHCEWVSLTLSIPRKNNKLEIIFLPCFSCTVSKSSSGKILYNDKSRHLSASFKFFKSTFSLEGSKSCGIVFSVVCWTLKSDSLL